MRFLARLFECIGYARSCARAALRNVAAIPHGSYCSRHTVPVPRCRIQRLRGFGLDAVSAVLKLWNAVRAKAASRSLLLVAVVKIWEFPKMRGTLLWGPYNKDPTIWGTIHWGPLFSETPYVKIQGYAAVRLKPVGFETRSFKSKGCSLQLPLLLNFSAMRASSLLSRREKVPGLPRELSLNSKSLSC